MTQTLNNLLSAIKACTYCSTSLPHTPNPIVRVQDEATILIIGQAPGTRVHKTHLPWNDPSGDRLRQWLNIDRDRFYNDPRIAIAPMGFCYPGKGKSGDLPPRPECAPLWHTQLLPLLPNLQLILLIGQYAQKYYLGRSCKKTLTETVRHWQEYQPRYFPLIHPSPRNTFWLQQNPWYEKNVIPQLQIQFRKHLLKKNN